MIRPTPLHPLLFILSSSSSPLHSLFSFYLYPLSFSFHWYPLSPLSFSFHYPLSFFFVMVKSFFSLSLFLITSSCYDYSRINSHFSSILTRNVNKLFYLSDSLQSLSDTGCWLYYIESRLDSSLFFLHYHYYYPFFLVSVPRNTPAPESNHM
jgi:hypothetical protein